jgi:hypothetical protein
MLPVIKKVRDEAIKVHRLHGQITIEQIVNIFEAFTEIDEINYIGYNVSPTNPIWGRFSKWQLQKSYGGLKTHCNVQYASHLNDIWRLFVVCKELCHALVNDNGSHSISDNSVVNLVNSLALSSASQRVKPSNPFVAEKLAEFGALEIIVPVSIRQNMLASGEYTSLSVEELSAKLNCPDIYIDYIFSQNVIDFSLNVL